MTEDINKSIQVLSKGGIVMYPTDTIWGIGCDAGNFKSVQRLYSIKGKVSESKFIVLLALEEDIPKYVKHVPDILFDLLDSFDLPTTIVYPEARNLAKNVIAKDGSIAIRVIKSGPAHDLVMAFGKPIVSTSANFSGDASPIVFKDISKDLIHEMDYVFQYGRSSVKSMRASTIIKLKPNGEFDIIRD